MRFPLSDAPLLPEIAEIARNWDLCERQRDSWNKSSNHTLYNCKMARNLFDWLVQN